MPSFSSACLTAFTLLALSSGWGSPAAAAAPYQTVAGDRVDARAQEKAPDAAVALPPPRSASLSVSDDSPWCLCALTMEEWIFLSQYEFAHTEPTSPH